MARGRKPQPDEIRDAKGDPGKRASEPAADDKLVPSAYAAPEWLKAKAVAYWDEVAPGLIKARLARETDRAMLAMFAEMVADWVAMGARIDRDGLVQNIVTYGHTDKPQKVKRAHPLLRERVRLAAQIKAFSDQLGLSPVARTMLMKETARSAEQGNLPLAGGDEPAAPSADAGADPFNYEPGARLN